MDKVLLIAVSLSVGRSSASGEGLPEPQNVHFYSVNLRNMVRWTPGEGSPNGSEYTVEYAVYGVADESDSEQVRWWPVKRCTSIRQTECDVSQETVSLHEEYYARVKAVSTQTQSLWSETSTRFRPMTDTILGAPLVDVTVVENYVNISMKGPFRWRTSETKKKKSLWKIFPLMIYNVSVYNSKSNYTQSFFLNSSALTLGPLEFSTRVCVVVSAHSQSIPLASKPSERMCAETPKDVFKDQLLAAMLGGVLPSALCLCVLAVLVGLVHCYITDHREKLPKSTDLVHVSEKFQTLQPEISQTIILHLISPGQEESKLIFPAFLPLPESVTVKEAPPLALPPAPLPAAESHACYAQQHVSVPDDCAAVSADWQDECSETDDAQPWPQYQQQNEAGDYGIVLSAKITESRQPENQEEEEEEEQQQIFLDWSPDTRELKIPLVSLLDPEDGDQTDAERDEVHLLPKVILRQCSEESSEQEDDFTKMERNWGLIIQ